MQDLSITSAAPTDVPTIVQLIHELADYEKLLHEVVATEARVAEALFGARPEAECLVARLGSRTVGFALFFHNFSTFLARPGLYLEDLYVRPEARGQGVGEALLRHLARLAVERKCGRMEWSVLNWNKRAIEFYERMGARGIKEWMIYRVDGAALLRLGS
jgi:ribosomal protein S18 acetylase RimI-like enzyme